MLKSIEFPLSRTELTYLVVYKDFAPEITFTLKLDSDSEPFAFLVKISLEDKNKKPLSEMYFFGVYTDEAPGFFIPELKQTSLQTL